MEKEVEDIKKLLVSKGMTIVTDVDIAAFKKAGEGAYKALNLTAARDADLQGNGQEITTSAMTRISPSRPGIIRIGDTYG